nr:MAG TPA: hypothetical protein [Caudoviricetes sp.]
MYHSPFLIIFWHNKRHPLRTPSYILGIVQNDTFFIFSLIFVNPCNPCKY